MAALVKVTGRRVEVVDRVIPDPPRAPQPSTPTGYIPPPPLPPAYVPWNLVGGFLLDSGYNVRNTLYEKTVTLSGSVYTGAFSSAAGQIGAWINEAKVKLYPDHHPLARTVIPERDYYNW